MKVRGMNTKTVAWLMVLAVTLVVAGVLLFSKGKWEVVDLPKHGRLEVKTASSGDLDFTYKSEPGYIGKDVFTVKSVFPLVRVFLPLSLSETPPIPIKLSVDRDGVHIVNDE